MKTITLGKKLICTLLSALILISTLPTVAIAGTADDFQPETWWDYPGVPVDLTQMDSMDIHEKAEFIEEFYKKVTFGPEENWDMTQGLAYCMLRIDTEGNEIRPIRSSDFKEGDYFFPTDSIYSFGETMYHPDIPSYYTNENTPVTSGLYLLSKLYRFEATGETGALEDAYLGFNSIWTIYNMFKGKKFDDYGDVFRDYVNAGILDTTGLLCKPYGFLPSNQTVADQYLYVVWALVEYYDFAAPAVQEQIREMVVAFADFWTRINYTIRYFDYYWDNKNEIYGYNGIMCFLQSAAYHFTNDEKYLNAATWFYNRGAWQTSSFLDNP